MRGLHSLRSVLVAAACCAAPATTQSQQLSAQARAPSAATSATQVAAPSPLITMLHSGRDSRTRFQAALTLGRMRPAGARDALVRALDDSDATVRASAAEALRTIGDAAAVPALRAHRADRDPTVRSTVERALALLDRNTPVAVPTTPELAVDWGRTRFVLRAGSLANRADQRSHVVDALRSALAQEVSRLDQVAFSVGTLPPEAERRVRSGRLRVYSIDGSVQQLRRWTVASTLSVRAEVSLVLVAVPARAIVGSMSGAATAQNTTAPGQSADTLARDLEQRALSGAVRGAVANLRSSLSGRS
jgi:hypothetical protein